MLVKLLNLKYSPETPPPKKKENVFMSLHCLDHNIYIYIYIYIFFLKNSLFDSYLSICPL